MRLPSLCTIAIGGMFATTAAMAAATQVNIRDPNATSRVAKVEVGNRLAVQEVSPSTYFHSDQLGLSDGCAKLATPPAGKALIVRQVRGNVYGDPSPGQGFVGIYLGDNCNVRVGNVSPPTIGLFTVTFDPGLAIPNGSSLSLYTGGSVGADVDVDAYKVDSSVVPQAGGQTIEISRKSRQMQ